MRIKGNNLDNELVIEIGKFAILWNCFERNHCHNRCGPQKIREIAPMLQISSETLARLARVLNNRSNLFNQIPHEYVATGLHPGNANRSAEDYVVLMNEFMEQEGNNLNAGCLLVINRIRNNLMHGLKRIEDLNGQLELFQAVNEVLESI